MTEQETERLCRAFIRLLIAEEINEAKSLPGTREGTQTPLNASTAGHKQIRNLDSTQQISTAKEKKE